MMGNRPIVSIVDIYDKMKQKDKNRVRYITHFATLYNTLLEMFTWEGLPDTIPKRFLESILHSEGQVFVSEIDGELYATSGTLSGEVDAYGMGTECIAVCPIGEARGRRNIDIAYGINNDGATPDMMTYLIAHLLGEVDKSLENNIKYARLLPIPKVSDDKDKAMFDEIIQKLFDGEPQAFASRNVLESELGNDSANVFELSDVNKIDKLQYLSRFTDDIMKRFYNIYGQSVQTQNKSAQSISDELHGMDSVSFIIPIQMLKCREALADNINRIFGTNITVKFSECWELEYKALVNRDLNENGIPDSVEDDPEGTEPEPDQEPELEPEPEPGSEPEPEPGSEPDPEPTDTPAADLEPEPDPEPDPEEASGDLETLASFFDVTIDELKEIIERGR